MCKGWGNNLQTLHRSHLRGASTVSLEYLNRMLCCTYIALCNVLLLLGQQLEPKTNSQQLDYGRGSMHQILRLQATSKHSSRSSRPIPKSSFECDHVVSPSRYKQISIIPSDPLHGKLSTVQCGWFFFIFEMFNKFFLSKDNFQRKREY